MRLVTVPFETNESFLSHYSEATGHGAVFCRTRARLSDREEVLVELSFPALPNRTLLRGTAFSVIADQGAWVRFAASESSTASYVVRCARGEVTSDEAFERTHPRFPADLPVDCRIDELDHHRRAPDRFLSRTRDLGAGGAFIVSANPPPVGTRVNLHIGPESASGERFALDGEVAWIRRGHGSRGFGVKFDAKGEHDTARLRVLLRRAAETGRLW